MYDRLANSQLNVPLPFNRAIDFDIMMMFLVTFLLLVFGFNGMIVFFEGVCF
jgi:hypothetical protein